MAKRNLYAGQHVHTIAPADVGRRTIPRDRCPTCGHRPLPIPTFSFMGPIQTIDIGKWIVQLTDGTYQVESNGQRDRRLGGVDRRNGRRRLHWLDG